MGILDIFRNAKPVEEPQKKAKRIGQKTIKQQMYRFNKQIDTWKLGINCFEDVWHSTTETIIGVYNDVVIDAHLSAALDNRIAKTTSKDFKIVDEKLEELDETVIFQSQWFRDFMRFSLESKFYGYSLIQFGDRVGDGFKTVKLVPREYVYPQKQSVRTTPQNTVDLIPFDKGQYKAWTLGVGRPEDIGLLMKAAPLVIYKKTALGSWSEFTELFGSPFRFGKTNVRDEALRDNMYDMLDNMGRNAFGVFHTDDELEYIKDSQTDAHHVFDELIERTNSELSKLILGSTMTMDDGSSRSQSEVHERTTGAIEKEDALFMTELVNKQLIPWLNTYHGFNIVGTWVFDDTENLSKPEQFKIDLEIVKAGYNVPKEYFTETYGTPIDEPLEVEETPDPKGGKSLDADNVLKKKAFSLTAYENFIGLDSCDICNTIDLSDTPEPTWSDAFIDEIITGVHTGLYTLNNLPESLYLETADRLVKSMLEGVAESKVIPTIADPDFIRALRNNAYVFSGAKTFQEVKTMSDFLIDENGDFRSFADFKKKAGATFDQFNKHWLRTEMTQAHNTAEAASKWQQFEEEKEVFPMLRYDTAGDERVRSSHKALDGVIKPVDDPFWDTHAAPNGWNCRCELLQESEAVETPDADIEVPKDIPDSMQFNPGKQKVLFSPEHPYFIVDDQFSELRDNNFGLPEPGKFVVPEVGKVSKRNWAGEKNNTVKSHIISEFQSHDLDATSVMFKKDMDRGAMSQQVNQISSLLSEYKVAEEWAKSAPFKVSFASTTRAHGFMKYTIRGGRVGTTLNHNNFNVGHRTPGRNQTFNDSHRLDKTRLTGKSKVDEANIDIATTTHEFAHFLGVSSLVRANGATGKIKGFFDELSIIRLEYRDELLKLNKAKDKDGLLKIHLGNYANTNIDEFFAETFTEYKLSKNPSKYAKKAGLLIDKHFKK